MHATDSFKNYDLFGNKMTLVSDSWRRVVINSTMEQTFAE